MKTSLVLETLKHAEELRAYRSTLKIAPDGLQMDASMLDWLEKQDLDDTCFSTSFGGDVGINVGHGPCYGKTLREAIFAAMTQETK